MQKGIINYITVNHAIWPLDTTGFLMLRLLTKFKWFEYLDEVKTRISLVTTFFNAVLRKNRVAATNKTCILSYRQQEEVLKEVLSSNRISPEPPLREKPYKQQQQARNNYNQQPFNSGGKAANQKSSFKRAMYKGNPLCYCFNDTQGRGCSNDKTTEGYKNKKDGTPYAHRCNVYMKEKGEYCLASHPRKQHKF